MVSRRRRFPGCRRREARCRSARWITDVRGPGRSHLLVVENRQHGHESARRRVRKTSVFHPGTTGLVVQPRRARAKLASAVDRKRSAPTGAKSWVIRSQPARRRTPTRRAERRTLGPPLSHAPHTALMSLQIERRLFTVLGQVVASCGTLGSGRRSGPAGERYRHAPTLMPRRSSQECTAFPHTFAAPRGAAG